MPIQAAERIVLSMAAVDLLKEHTGSLNHNKTKIVIIFKNHHSVMDTNSTFRQIESKMIALGIKSENGSYCHL
jgi:hypothetical protein